MTRKRSKLTQQEIALVQQLTAWRMDYIRTFIDSRRLDIKKSASKGELYTGIADAVKAGTVTAADIATYLDEIEDGNKQHVYVMRPAASFTNGWPDTTQARNSLARRNATKALLNASAPKLLPDSLALSSISVTNDEVIVRAVVGRDYTDRVKDRDYEETDAIGARLEYRAWVHRTARTTITFRWELATRWASLHITQASGRGQERDYYSKMRREFAGKVKDWLDLGQFKDHKLHRAIEALRKREEAKQNVLTTSTKGRWATPSGSTVDLTGASTNSSMYDDPKVRQTTNVVASNTSGSTANVRWIDLPTDYTQSTDIHLNILAADARVHFMGPTSGAAVAHVLATLRSLR